MSSQAGGNVPGFIRDSAEHFIYGGLSTGATYNITLFQPYVAFRVIRPIQPYYIVFLCNYDLISLILAWISSTLLEMFAIWLQWSHSSILPNTDVYIASAWFIFSSKGEQDITMEKPCLTLFSLIGMTWFVTSPTPLSHTSRMKTTIFYYFNFIKLQTNRDSRISF